ncbi:hypothetical protein F511_47347 [Dorcoceras hygrometricum]|uniref:Uncharacterized protein n=1 Tax=Dorcoceras hygrometricum TaxID=472368 RepID=A0A2Z6ZXL1_9LAMI|nr:hypothetical protein F511_47347 [Dorcoceras hygrometricum]
MGAASRAAARLIGGQWPLVSRTRRWDAHWLRNIMAALRAVAGRYMRRAWRGSARPCAARYVAAAVAVRPPSDVSPAACDG